jgi:hypothetical protein
MSAYHSALQRLGATILGTLLLAHLPGCGGGSTNPGGSGPDRASELQDVGTMLQLAGGNKPAAKLADLAKLEGNFPQSYAALKSGEIVVNWGVKMPGEGDVASAPQEVVAYEKKTATEGGLVLYLNGKVSKLSADQFKSAKMAK